MLFIIGVCVSAGFILRVQSAVPVALTGAFGVCAFAALVFTVYFMRRSVVAVRLCRENEKLSSTEEGARLAVAEDRLARLTEVLSAAPVGETDETAPAEEKGEADSAQKTDEAAPAEEAPAEE